VLGGFQRRLLYSCLIFLVKSISLPVEQGDYFFEVINAMSNESLEKVHADWIDGVKWKDSWIDVLVIVVAIVFVAASLLFHAEYAHLGLFPRSGAVLILAGALMEYRQSKFERRAFEQSIRFSAGFGGHTVFGLPRHRGVIVFIARLYILSGTVIWAYSSLLLPLW